MTSHGPRRGTRHLLRKNVRERGKVTITRHLQEFKEGQKVMIKPEPSIQKGIPHRRFFNKVGTVIGKKGKSYILEVREFNKLKKITLRPIHLREMI